MSRLWISGGLALALACNGDSGETGATQASTTSEATTSAADGSESAPATETGAATAVDMGGGQDGECSLILQDCPEGLKCVPWNMSGGIFPDGVRCVDAPPNPDMVGEMCTVTGGFGSGKDTCAKGSFCFDLDNDSMGSCVEFCSGTPETPKCSNPGEKCTVFFDPPVPLCFVKCDPLVQDCPIGQGCYMDEAMLGSEGFVCMPTVLAPNENGDYGDLCFNQAGCAPGFSCIYPENVPGCKYEYCCSPWCNIVENPELCASLDPKMECVPWYPEGMATPGYEEVGICGIPL